MEVKNNYLAFNTLRVLDAEIATAESVRVRTLLGKSTTGASVRPGLLSELGGAFGGFFGVGTSALGSTEDAFAFAAARIFGVGAKR